MTFFDEMKGEPTRNMVSLLALVLSTMAKVFVFLETADISAHFFPGHKNLAYTLGLFLGVLIQSAIPPWKSWKKQMLWFCLIAAVAGAAHPFFRRL